MPVDFAGLPCDYEAINKIAKDKSNLFLANSENQKALGRILVLSDSAHSYGAWQNKKRAGSLTDVSVFSFHAVKNLTTAEGGAVALNLPTPFDNEEVYKELCIKTLHGQNKDALAKTQKGNWKYDIVEAGYKCNMTDIQAAIGQVELERYDSETLPRRKEICDFYTNFLGNYAWAQTPILKKENDESCYHLYPFRVKGITEDQRDEIIQKIFDFDVSVNVHFIPVPKMSFYVNMGYDLDNYPTTKDNFIREISLPVFVDITDEQMNRVVEAVVSAVESTINS